MPKSILDIKNSIDCHVGNRIVLKVNRGRKKTIKRFGILEETHPSVSIIELDQDRHSFKGIPYTYIDVLTKDVQALFEEDNHYESIAH